MQRYSPEVAPATGYRKVNGLWRNKSIVFVPPELRDDVLINTHTLAFSGHPGISKTTELVKRKFWWPGWRADCKDFVSKCQQCQLVKNDKKRGTAVQPLPVPLRPWESVAIDLLTGLPTVKVSGKYYCTLASLYPRESLRYGTHYYLSPYRLPRPHPLLVKDVW